MLSPLIGFNQTVAKSDYTMCIIGNIFFMGNQYNRIAGSLNFIENFHDLDRRFCVEVTCGFISQNQRRIVHQCSCNGHPLTLTS